MNMVVETHSRQVYHVETHSRQVYHDVDESFTSSEDVSMRGIKSGQIFIYGELLRNRVLSLEPVVLVQPLLMPTLISFSSMAILNIIRRSFI